MEYRRLGQAGVKVSPICLGAGVRGELDEQRFIRTIEYAIDQGCNFIDCANNYGQARRIGLSMSMMYWGRSRSSLPGRSARPWMQCRIGSGPKQPRSPIPLKNDQQPSGKLADSFKSVGSSFPEGQAEFNAYRGPTGPLGGGLTDPPAWKV